MKFKLFVKNLILNIFYYLKSLEKEFRYAGIKKKYNIHSSVKFNGSSIKIYGDGSINIGPNTYIGENSFISSSVKTNISIGSNCAISHNVKIYSSSYIVDTNFINDKIKKTADVIIGDGVWIGVNVYIGPGVTIGDNSVIGANSVVIKDVNANTINSGIPCGFIRKKTNV